MQVTYVSEIHIDHQPVKVRLALHKLQIRDIGRGFADQGADPPQYARAVADGDVQRAGIDRRVTAIVPTQVQPTLGLVLVFRQAVAVD